MQIPILKLTGTANLHRMSIWTKLFLVHQMVSLSISTIIAIIDILDKKQSEVRAENAPTCLSPVEEQEVQTSSEITSEFTSEITSEFTSEPAIIEEIPAGEVHSKIERKNTIDDEMIMPIEEIGTNSYLTLQQKPYDMTHIGHMTELGLTLLKCLLLYCLSKCPSVAI